MIQVIGKYLNNMSTITIRNKKTGETKTIQQDELLKFGLNSPKETQLGSGTPQEGNTAVQAIQARLQELQGDSQPQQQPEGDFMNRLLQSRALPIGGSVLGGGIGVLAGPVTGVAGAGAGYAGGDVIRKELSNLLGVKGKQAERTAKSVGETAKGAATAGLSQGVGQTAAYALKFIKPGTITGFLGKATDYLSKKGTFGNISPEILETRFMNEVIPKALRWTESQGEDVVSAGEKLIKSKIKEGPKFFDAEELNFLRKNLNALGEGAEGMKDALIKGLAKIVREEQVKRAPGAAVTLPVDKAVREGIQGLRAFWPTRMALMITDMLRSTGAGVGRAIGRFGGAPLIGGASQKE